MDRGKVKRDQQNQGNAGTEDRRGKGKRGEQSGCECERAGSGQQGGTVPANENLACGFRKGRDGLSGVEDVVQGVDYPDREGQEHRLPPADRCGEGTGRENLPEDGDRYGIEAQDIGPEPERKLSSRKSGSRMGWNKRFYGFLMPGNVILNDSHFEIGLQSLRK